MVPVRTVAVGGLGAIGLKVAQAVDAGIDGLRLAAVSARDAERASARLRDLDISAPVIPLEDLAESADIVVECVPAAEFDRIAQPAIEAGRTFIPLSVGALLDRGVLIDRAGETGATIIVPSGAILGLDALKAASEGVVHAVTHIMRKPPGSLVGAPYLERNGISLDSLVEPLLIFKGPAREGARNFPANANVSAAVSLAGIGPDRTVLEIWADPGLNRNTHKVVVEAESARFSVEAESLPDPGNPRTGLLTPLSVIATLRGLGATLRVGT